MAAADFLRGRAAVRPEEISRPDKPLFPDGITKLDLARYYDAVAPVMVPHVTGAR